jgi:hypothetical protein
MLVKDTLYALDAGLLAVLVLAFMLGALELGALLGRGRRRRASEPLRDHVGNMQGSLLGLTALLLGFSFSLALQRFDSRSQAEVQEANSIGTTWLRSALLPEPQRAGVQTQLRRYIDLRAQASAISLAEDGLRDRLLVESNAALAQAWTLATEAAIAEPNPVRTGLFLQALNDTIDQLELRDAELRRHVPEAILLLLLASFVMTAGSVGYSVGLSGERPPLLTHGLMAMIALLAFVVIDLDRPRRGLIQVDQSSLLKLQAEWGESAGRG